MTKTFTEEIFQESCPWDNRHQGNGLRLVFVCSAGLLRSPTCQKVASELDINARCAGSANYALIPLSANLIAWAHKIVFVNFDNYAQSAKIFTGTEYSSMLREKAVTWDIPDHFDWNNPALVNFVRPKIQALKDEFEGLI